MLRCRFPKLAPCAHSLKLAYQEMSQNWQASLFTTGRWVKLFEELSTWALSEREIEFWLTWISLMCVHELHICKRLDNEYCLLSFLTHLNGHEAHLSRQDGWLRRQGEVPEPPPFRAHLGHRLGVELRVAAVPLHHVLGGPVNNVIKLFCQNFQTVRNSFINWTR